MIAVINVEITAANPSMPLFPWRAYVNSPSSLRIRNVPRRVGNWNIDKVYVSAAYPDGSIKSSECVLVGGIWVCTIAGSTVSGFSQNGYTIFADGKDENGNEVTGYVLGKGDITILEADGTITPGEDTYYVHMLSAQPTAPKDGDLWQLSGTWYIYQDGTSYPIGDDSGLIQQLSARVDEAESDIEDLQAGKQDKLSDPQISAIDSVVDERTTYVKYQNGSVSAFNIVGELGSFSIPNIQNAVEVKLGNMVTSIGELALASGQHLSSVTIPDSVTSIGDNAFRACANLSNIKIGDGVTSIGELAFAQCTSLTNVTIPDSVQSIGAEAFYDCGRLSSVTIGNGVTSIGDSAFYFCGGLTSITIPDSVTSIGVYAFGGCNFLTDVTIGDGVISIGDVAFSNCTSLNKVTIGNSVTSIGNSAFEGCTSLTSVTFIDNGLHNLKTIGDSAFKGCSSLISITLPQGIATIGVDAFAGTVSYFKLYLTEAIPSWVPGSVNYPWGVAYPANIITVRNATKEWVEEQAYGKGFTYNAGSISPRPTPRHIKLVPFTITSLTLTSATSSFECRPQGTAGTVAREIYFALTIGNFTQPMTWNASCDVFKGGSAAAIAPTEGLNFYHIFEYASGHFMVEKII